MRKHLTIAMLSAVAIAGCSPSAAPVTVPSARGDARFVQRAASVYKTVYNFKGIPDGAFPNGHLLYSNGAIYGTTYYGGDYGGGTFFRLSASGTERVEDSFYVHSKQDFANPLAIALLGGTFYGTATQGGANSEGAAYDIPSPGKARLLYSFGSGTNARAPYSGLLPLNGKLYGEAGGGVYGCGSIYSLTPRGQERLIISLSSVNGCAPVGGLIAVNGTLYGTSNGAGPYNGGTVFSLTTAGKVTVLHSFGGSDGSQPYGGVIALHGTLYGTTTEGGAYGGGVVFSLSRSGKERILHDFGSSGDGSGPSGRLTVRDNVLYGTTPSGGSYGKGTFFSLTMSGAETIIHNFGQGHDGAQPAGNLLQRGAAFYGTTVNGGNVCSGAGCGTVFEVTP